MTTLGKNKHLSDAQISAYVDDALTEQQQRKVEAHLRHCPSCASKVAATRRTKQMLAALPAPPLPRAFTLTQADIATAKRARRWHWLRPFWNAATVVTALLLVFLMGRTIIIPATNSAAPIAAKQVEMASTVRTVSTRTTRSIAPETPRLLRAPVGAVAPPASNTITATPASAPSLAVPQSRALSDKAITSAQPAPAQQTNPFTNFFTLAIWPKVALALLLALLLASRPLLPQ